MNDAFTPAPGLCETSGQVLVADLGKLGDSPAALRALIQTFIDRDAYIKDTLLDEGAFRVENGTLQIKMTNKTGSASVAGQLVVPARGVVVDGGSGYVTSSTITGKTNVNTKAGRLWYKLSIPAAKATIQVYKDEAKTALVAHGALGDNLGGTINLSEDNASGIGGTVVVTAAVAALDTTGEYLTVGTVNAFSTAIASETEAIGVCQEAGVASGAEAWVAIAGTAQCLFEAGATGDAAYGDWVRSGATTAGRVQADTAWNALYADRYIGRSVGRKEYGVGTTCGVMLLPKRSSPLPGIPADGTYHLAVAAGVASWVAV
jgi:hypothetical protein